jgi:hypothetical protein
MPPVTQTVKQALRDRLRSLLDIEQLESPQQLITFDEATFKNVSSWELFQKSVSYVHERKARYIEYDRMDENSDINASLSAYADECSPVNREKKRKLWVSGPSEEINDALHMMLDTIKFEDMVYGVARSLAKYGDHFQQVFYDTERGIYMVKYIEPNRMDRQMDDQNRLRGWKVEGLKTFGGSRTQSLADPWDFVHFKINGTVLDGWGESMLAGVQKTFRTLEMLETAQALYRLARASDRNVFYVDVGTASSDQAYNIVNMWKQTFRKRKWHEANGAEKGAGGVDFKHNPIDPIEDIWWPVRKDSESRVEKLPGSNNVGDITDIEYFRNKLRYGLGIPPEYFGSTEGGSGLFRSDAGLVQQDMKFARKCLRLQSAVRAGVTRLCQIHLALLGVPSDGMEFTVEMEPLSYLEEMQRMEAMMTRVTVLQGLVEMGMVLGFEPQAWSEFLLSDIMALDDENISRFLEGQAENLAAQMQQQKDNEQEQHDSEQKQSKAQTMSLFAKAQQGKEQAAKKPGGNSGVTVKKKKPSAKSKPKKVSEQKTLTEIAERPDEFLVEFEDFLRAHRARIDEIKEVVVTSPETVVINA